VYQSAGPQPCTNINLCTRVQDIRPAPTLNCLSECWCQPSTTLICVSRVQNVSPASSLIRVRMQDINHTQTLICVSDDISPAQTLICVSMNPCINQINVILIQQMQNSVFKKGNPVVFEYATEATEDINFKNNTAKPPCRFTEYEKRATIEI